MADPAENCLDRLIVVHQQYFEDDYTISWQPQVKVDAGVWKELPLIQHPANINGGSGFNFTIENLCVPVGGSWYLRVKAGPDDYSDQNDIYIRRYHNYVEEGPFSDAEIQVEIFLENFNENSLADQ